MIRQIDSGYPIPTLIPEHQSLAMEAYVWHWFLLNGYDDTGEKFLVKAVTYSKYEWLDLRELWDTGRERYKLSQDSFLQFICMPIAATDPLFGKRNHSADPNSKTPTKKNSYFY